MRRPGVKERISSFIYPDPLNAEKFQQLRKLVREHPEWSDDQAANALREAGAKFGPWNQADFTKTIPVSQLERFFKPWSLSSVHFRVRSENAVTEAGKPDAEMLWDVRLVSDTTKSHKISYYLLFEPFEGKLVVLGHLPIG